MIRQRGGVTLLELLIALVVMGIAAGIVGLAGSWGEGLSSPDAAQQLRALVAEARRVATMRGRATTVVLPQELLRAIAASRGSAEAGSESITALPDGSVLAPLRYGIARLTGEIPR